MRGGHVRRARRLGRGRQALAGEGAVGARRGDDFLGKAEAPAGHLADGAGRRRRRHAGDLVPSWRAGDVIIDGGNSFYRDDIDRAKRARPRSALRRLRDERRRLGARARLLPHDRRRARRGRRLDPLFATLAPGAGDLERTPGREGPPSTAERGYLHCGPSGAGHFVKMVHNGIEYGLMAAYAEGFNILHKANIGKADRRRRGDHAAAQPRVLPVRLEPGRHRRGVAAGQRRRIVVARSDGRCAAWRRRTGEVLRRVSDSGEGRWTLDAAIDEAVPAHVLAAALFERFSSRGEAGFRIGCCPRCASSSAATSRRASRASAPRRRLPGDPEGAQVAVGHSVSDPRARVADAEKPAR